MKEFISIYFNGKYAGETKRPETFVKKIRKRRRQGILSPYLNIAYYPEFEEIRINTDHGRVRRPLIIIENGKPKLTEAHVKALKAGKIDIFYLMEHGMIEFLDANEEENAFVALKPENITKEHTHIEISPSTILGISATFIPYPEYNRGDRINYGAKMMGQAIGLFLNNYQVRSDTKFNIFSSPQFPLINTGIKKILNNYPEGQNVVVAVMCHDGYNLNDAIVMNKSSIERGLFRSFYYRTYETAKKRYWGGQEDEITIPEPGVKGHLGEKMYKYLDEDGIINPEAEVESNDVLIGKISPLRFLFREEFAGSVENKRETSISVRHGERGIIDEVLITETPNAEQLVKVRVRNERIPEIGDKFASRHGQKGVVGLLVKHEDMPFTSEGVVPDIIFNPHAVPSRMTIGQLLELLSSKTATLNGKEINANAFADTKESTIRKTLKKLGFREDGKEVLYDGKTGKKYEVLIFTGLSYYLKLDHMVVDKIHVRSRGPVTLLTKQPTEGRAKRGGLRLGEMEQQCFMGHGAALLLKERFDSDLTTIPICKNCGIIAVHDVAKNRTFCGICKESNIAWVKTGYAFKLTLDELKAMGILPKLELEEE